MLLFSHTISEEVIEMEALNVRIVFVKELISFLNIIKAQNRQIFTKIYFQISRINILLMKKETFIILNKEGM